MKRHYVVMQPNGYYEAKNKIDALAFMAENARSTHVIYTGSQCGNYYHNRIKTIATKD